MKFKIKVLAQLTIILFSVARTTMSQVNSYALNHTVTNSTGTYTIDIDSNGTNDYTFEILLLSGSATAARVVSLGSSQVMDSSTFGYPDPLNFGDSITGPYSSGNGVLGTDVGGAGQFSGAGLKYLGSKTNISGKSHLGWLSLEVVATNDTIILHEVGYNTVANSGIYAGQKNSINIDQAKLIEFGIYPNPGQDVLVVDWPGYGSGVDYSISDLSGNLLIYGTATRYINISDLALGSYVLTITEGQKVGRKIFVKN